MGSKNTRRVSGHPGRRAEQMKPQSKTQTPAREVAAYPRPRPASQPAKPQQTSHPFGSVSKAAPTLPSTGRNPAPRPRKAPSTARGDADADARQHSWEEEVLALDVDEVQPAADGWFAQVLQDTDPRAVAATYTFTPPDDGGSVAAVRFVGLREDVDGERDAQDVFDRTERFPDLPAGGSEVSVTTRARGVAPGRWRVLARVVNENGEAVADTPPHVVQTDAQFHQLAMGPRVRLWAWPLLIGLGALLALVVQALLATTVGIGVLPILGLSLVGCLLGFVGGKIWYLGLHRKPLRDFLESGACIQGFLLVSLAVLALGSLLMGWPMGVVLDITTPGVFLGMAVGRPGCFLTGCCAGRPTASRWGLVSSDRRLTVRRIPVQLIEASAGLVIGLATLAGALAGLSPAGSVFVAAIAAYTLVRQLLFGLRVESRTQIGRIVTSTASGLVLLAAAGLWLT